MQSWNIFKHAVEMLWGNRLDAARLAFLPWAVITLVNGLLIKIFYGNFSFVQPAIKLNPDQIAQINWLPIIIITVISWVGFTWIVIGWHRYILLEEKGNGVVPALHLNLIINYIGNSFKIGFVVLIPLMLISVVFGLIALYVLNSSTLAQIFPLLIFTFVLVIFFRLSILLPAVAIGQSFGIRQAWETTTGKSWIVFQLALALSLCNVVIQGIIGALPASLITQLMQVAASGVMGLLGASTLTTMYGLWVEGREL